MLSLCYAYVTMGSYGLIDTKFIGLILTASLTMGEITKIIICFFSW